MSTTSDRIPVLTGGCQCGAVRYAAYALPEDPHLCHCRMCQKAVGNVFAALAPLRREDLVWTRGQPAFFRSSSLAQRGFCASCGTPLAFAYDDSERISVTIGSLDRPELVPPKIHYGAESAVPWLHLADTLERRTTEADMEATRRARYASFQHPDHEAPQWVPPVAPGPSGGD